MLGREAYHNPWWLSEWDASFFDHSRQGESDSAPHGDVITRESIEQHMVNYMVRESAAHGTRWPSIARHMLGLRHGLPGARHWRRVWSDHSLKDTPPEQVMALAHGA
jgi:tRNA-dihydrouridine synthase A